MGDREGIPQGNLCWVKAPWTLAPICPLPWRCCCHGDRGVHIFPPFMTPLLLPGKPHSSHMIGKCQIVLREPRGPRSQCVLSFRDSRGGTTPGAACQALAISLVFSFFETCSHDVAQANRPHHPPASASGMLGSWAHAIATSSQPLLVDFLRGSGFHSSLLDP